jgi:hypothetical protein
VAAYSTVLAKCSGYPRRNRLIEAFRELTGVPMELNTSFNENEPVVCEPREALKLAGGYRHATLDLPPREAQASLRLLGIIHRVRLIGDNLLTQPEDDRGPNKDRFRPRSS